MAQHENQDQPNPTLAAILRLQEKFAAFRAQGQAEIAVDDARRARLIAQSYAYRGPDVPDDEEDGWDRGAAELDRASYRAGGLPTDAGRLFDGLVEVVRRYHALPDPAFRGSTPSPSHLNAFASDLVCVFAKASGRIDLHDAVYWMNFDGYFKRLLAKVAPPTLTPDCESEGDPE